MHRILSVTAFLTLAFACTPVEEEPVRITDGATLCLRAGELTAQHDGCGSSCGTVNASTCEIDGDTLTTFYDYTPQSSEEVCTADCRIVESTCGTPSGDSVEFAGDTVDLTALPDCDTV